MLAEGQPVGMCGLPCFVSGPAIFSNLAKSFDITLGFIGVYRLAAFVIIGNQCGVMAIVIGIFMQGDRQRQADAERRFSAA